MICIWLRVTPSYLRRSPTMAQSATYRSGRQFEEFMFKRCGRVGDGQRLDQGEFQPAQLIGMSNSFTDLPLSVIFSRSFSYCLIFFASTCIFAQSRPCKDGSIQRKSFLPLIMLRRENRVIALDLCWSQICTYIPEWSRIFQIRKLPFNGSANLSPAFSSRGWNVAGGEVGVLVTCGIYRMWFNTRPSGLSSIQLVTVVEPPTIKLGCYYYVPMSVCLCWWCQLHTPMLHQPLSLLSVQKASLSAEHLIFDAARFMALNTNVCALCVQFNTIRSVGRSINVVWDHSRAIIWAIRYMVY